MEDLNFKGYIQIGIKCSSSGIAIQKLYRIIEELNENNDITAEFKGLECHGKGK